MKYTYLLVNFFAVIVPFIFSFHPKLRFYKNWAAFFAGALLSAVPFLIWDVWATENGVWGFNPQYLVGLYIYNLPLEEVLFFICIPFASVFTYHCFEIFLKKDFSFPGGKVLPAFLIVFFLIVGLFHLSNAYTAITFIVAAALLAVVRYWLNPSWLEKFYVVFAVILVPFLIVNGVLTGTGLDSPIVWYNEAEIIGWRILTIPVEDASYALAMLLLNVVLYQYFVNLFNRQRPLLSDAASAG